MQQVRWIVAENAVNNGRKYGEKKEIDYVGKQ